MNCILIDDSLVARKALALLIGQIGFLTLKKEFDSPKEALNYLKTEKVDLIFLDIEMPDISGIEFIKHLKQRPIIILVSSKTEYAVEAFELNVADYLVKPVTLPRFTAAADKAKEIFDSNEKTIETGWHEPGFIFVRSNSSLTKIKLDEILYIQALGDYIKIHTEARHTLVHSTLKTIEEKLPRNKFFRLHRSYIVALDKIDKIEEYDVYLGKHTLPIGEQYKKDLIKKLNLL